MSTTTKTETTTSGSTTTTVTTTKTCIACPPAGTGDSGAIVACKCGMTKIKYTVAQPRSRLECCCVDCNDAFRWAQTKGGPKPSGDGWASDSWYFENDITILSGEEHIKFYLLQEGYLTKRMVATCCHSTLCGDHPGYLGNVCITYGDFLQSGNFMPQLMRFCIDDVPEDKRQFLKDTDFEFGSCPNASEEEVGKILDLLVPKFEPPPSTKVGKTIQQLIEEKGLTVLDWEPTNGKRSPLAEPKA